MLAVIVVGCHALVGIAAEDGGVRRTPCVKNWAPAEGICVASLRVGDSPVGDALAPMPPGRTLAELEAMGECNNPTMRQAAARIEAAKAEWLQAGLYPNPQAGYQANEIGDEGQAGQQGAFISQEFVTGGKLRLGRDVAYQAIQQANWAYQAQRQRVVNDVRQAFYDVLEAQRTVELTSEMVHVCVEAQRVAEELQRAKEVSRVDVLQAHIEADTNRVLLDKANHHHQAIWRQLAVLIGDPNMQPIPLTGDIHDGLTNLRWEDIVGRVLANHPGLAEARVAVAKADAELSRQCAERRPNVDVQAGVAYDNATQDQIAEVQVGIPLQVFNRNQGNIRKAQAELVHARNEVRRVELDIQQRLAIAFEQYENGHSEVSKYKDDILPNAQASLDLVTQGYRQGELEYVALLTMQRTFYQANLAYVEAVSSLREAVVAIEGNLLRDSLQQR